jgi:diguanylate cyclase (GGDEF)-like protein/PAS domain S-box-containing protein
MLDRARDTGLPAASAPLTLLQESGAQRSVLVARPLYRRMAPVATVAERRENLIGFVVMALRMGDMVANALNPVYSSGFLVALDDQSLRSDRGSLLAQQTLLGSAGNSVEALQPGHAWTEHSITFAGRHWSLRLAPTAAAVASQRSLVAWAILIGGMMFTSLLGAFLLTVTGRAVQVHDLMEARARADAHFRLAVEAAPSALILANQDGLMTLVNAQAEKMFGYDRQEMLGKPIEMLVPARYHGAHAGHRRGFFGHPEARLMGVGRDLYGSHKNGSEVPVEVGLNTLRTDEGLFVLASIIDITERKRITEIMRQAQTNVLRESILDSAPFSIIAVDVQGKIISANPASLRLLGYEKNQLLDKHAATLIHLQSELDNYAAAITREFGRPVRADHQALSAYAEPGLSDEHEWIYVRKDGSQVPVNLSVTALRDEQGHINGYLNIAYDISERRRNAETILHMAHHDALTELPNRALLMDRVEMAIRRGRRSNSAVAVLMLDLDHFKRVNDTLGHQAGDELLLAVARRIQNSLRDTDTVARLGGDEFVVVLTDAGTRDELQENVKRIIHRITAPITIENQELLITTSIGGCLFPDDGEDAVALIKNADTAMYAAKTAGRNNFQWFSPEMQKQTEAKLVMTGAMQHALDNQQFSLHYQPEIHLASGELVGFEALIRWQHPQYGSISPDQFIPLAEETGLIMPIGEWVLRTACCEIVNIEKESGCRLTLAVNVSPRQFQHKDWIDIVRSAIKDSGIRPSQLELEITEGMLMDKPRESALVLHELREIGTGVVLDDFGTGYSSLSYLSRFPVSKIKIDRSFVRDLTQDSTDAAVIDAVIAMAHSLKISVIAEGIETGDQLAYLLKGGCDQGQGFYFSKAVSRAEIASLMTTLSQTPVEA